MHFIPLSPPIDLPVSNVKKDKTKSLWEQKEIKPEHFKNQQNQKKNMGISNTGEILCFTILGLSVIILGIEAPMSEAIEKVEEIFLKEEKTNRNPEYNISGTFCDSKEPICQKFVTMLQNQKTKESNVPVGSRERRSYAQHHTHQVDCNPKDPMCQKFQLMLGEESQRKLKRSSDMVQSEDVNQENIEHTEAADKKLDCDETNPICQKFQALLRFQEREHKRKQTQGNKNPSSLETGTTAQTPWCDFYCDFFQHKICYDNGICGDPVLEDQKP